MASTISALGSDGFPGSMVGSGRPRTEDECVDSDAVVDHVLSAFSAEKERAIKPVIATVSRAIDRFLIQGIEAAMNRFT